MAVTIDGSGSISGVPGAILQVVSATKTDTFSTTSSSFVDVTDLTVTLTPSTSSSKILVFATVNVGSDNGTNRAAIRLVRGSTAIAVGAAAGSRILASAAASSANDDDVENLAVSILDSPATTSATTYKVQMLGTGTGTVYVNRSTTDTDSSVFYRTASTITVIEVAA